MWHKQTLSNSTTMEHNSNNYQARHHKSGCRHRPPRMTRCSHRQTQKVVARITSDVWLLISINLTVSYCDMLVPLLLTHSTVLSIMAWRNPQSTIGELEADLSPALQVCLRPEPHVPVIDYHSISTLAFTTSKPSSKAAGRSGRMRS
jgi:hypothetical protein